MPPLGIHLQPSQGAAKLGMANRAFKLRRNGLGKQYRLNWDESDSANRLATWEFGRGLKSLGSGLSGKSRTTNSDVVPVSSSAPNFLFCRDRGSTCGTVQLPP